MTGKTLNLTDNLYQYLLDNSLRETEIQKKLREHTAGLEWSQMQIAPEQGQFMAFLVKLLGVKKVIEVGVFTGYSSLSVALALPADGQLTACDINQEWTDIAQRYWREAGVDHKINLHLAPAQETLQGLINSEQHNTYDFAFIDADKENYDIYYESCLTLLRPGGLLLVDNTLWGGAVADSQIQDKDTLAIRALNTKIQHDQRVEMCLLAVADGLTLVMLK